ncbi:surface antigen (D15) [Flavobacterium limnosediminis JC2902]|uniref:Surface antigen (D15) n=1 Tax=Flavobacterium limnosediminis JC2902 TaxID=1341181 RepID=V6SUY4_9FLAO|nr:BamA/TamA family outer membrane protein [Flavobacterium limnosediminis]ESU29987.1 surface antigen (D15) [Flavobacterium limnosediminis JC2902]
MQILRNKSIPILYGVVMLLFCGTVSAQTQADSISPCKIVAIPDLFKKKDSTTILKPIKNSFLIVMPIIGSQPATGFMYGAVAQYTFKGDQPKDKYSTVSLNVTYTTKKQLMINVKNNVLLKNNSIFLSGDWRYYIFTQSNYGLGTDIIPPNSSDDGFSLDAITEPMDYDYFKFHQTISWEFEKNYYMGGGVAIDIYTSIEDKNLKVEEGQYTEHYNYSQLHGFDNLEYVVNGLSFNMVHDSRDNQINPNNGWFANFNYRFNPSLNDRQRKSQILFGEYRHFIPLSPTNKQHVLGFWTYGQFLIQGDLPYLNLPAIGWDQRSRGGKGYTQGLFRGFDLVYFETEYRFPITCNQLISGTVFANFTTASNDDTDVKLFQYIQPAAGIGLRFLIDKPTRTNIILNYAWGRDSKAFYLNAGETF